MQEMSAVRGANVDQIPLFPRLIVNNVSAAALSGTATAEGSGHHKQDDAEILTFSRPARTFTGDFYFTHRERDRLWLAHGDVAGKGLPAAIVMAMIQEELEHRITACAALQCDPAATMQRLHEFLRPLLPKNRFATGVIGHLRDDGTLTIANGGHCPPLIIHRDGTIEEIGSTGPLLGILNHAEWRSMTTRLDYGETLVLYSDGVIESCADLGVAGLKRVLASGARTPDEVMAQIGKTTDDVTLVMVRR